MYQCSLLFEEKIYETTGGNGFYLLVFFKPGTRNGSIPNKISDWQLLLVAAGGLRRRVAYLLRCRGWRIDQYLLSCTGQAATRRA